MGYKIFPTILAGFLFIAVATIPQPAHASSFLANLGCAIYTLVGSDVCSELSTPAPSHLTASVANSQQSDTQQQEPQQQEVSTQTRVVERVIERVIEKQPLIVQGSGVSEEDLQVLENELRKEIAQVGTNGTTETRYVTQRAFSQSQNIDQLNSVTITNATISRGVSGLTDSDIPNDITVSNYLPLTGGTLTGALAGTTITTSGNVGVGTSSPTHALAVSGETSNGWNLENAVYDNKSGSISSQVTTGEGNVESIFFKSDGTKMYAAATGNVVYQYSLSTAWDISTISYDSTSFDVSNEVSDTPSIFIGSSGSKMYVLDISSGEGTVYQYTLSTPWDISTASYDSVSFDESNETTKAVDIAFSTDGTDMYVLSSNFGNAEKVYQYSLSTAWDLSTASYESKVFDVASQAGGAAGVSFKSDGTKMFISDNENEGDDKVYEYILSTAWDLSSASYNSQNVSVNSNESSVQDVAFKSDGAKMYVTGSGNNTVYQYTTTKLTGGDLYVANKAGISDFSPDGILEISASNASSTDLFYISSNDDRDGDMLTVDTNGNVGIGTKTINRRLSIIGGGGLICTTGDGSCPTSESEGSLYVTSGVSTQPSDIAEWIQVDSSALNDEGETTSSAGDIMCTSESENGKAAKCSKPEQTPIGIVSTKPGFTLGVNKSGSDAVLLALAGRVPTKVTNENGKINRGDRIAISPTQPGMGVKATGTTRTVGIALDATDAQTDTIDVLVDLSMQTVSVSNGHLQSSLSGDTIPGISGNWRITEEGVLEVKKVKTSEVCWDDVCVDKNKMKQLLEAHDLLSTSTSQSVRNETDTEPPTITINGNNPAHVEVGSSYSDLGATVTDNEDDNLGIKAKVNGTDVGDQSNISIDTSTTSEHTIEYRATDQAGNTATKTRTVFVEDTNSKIQDTNNETSEAGGSSSAESGSLSSSETDDTTSNEASDEDTTQEENESTKETESEEVVESEEEENTEEPQQETETSTTTPEN